MNGGNALGAFFSELRQKNSARRPAQRNALGRRLERRVSSARVAARRALAVTRARTRRTRTRWPWPCPRSGASSAPPSRPRRFPDPPAARARRFHAPSPRIERAVSRPRPSSARRLPPQARQRLRAPRDRRALRRPRDADARVHRPRRGRVRGADRRQARRRVRRPIDPRAVATTALLSERKRNETRATRSMAIPRPSPSYARPPPAPFSRRHAIPTSPSLAPTTQTSSRATRTTT